MFLLALPMPLLAQVAEDSSATQQPQTYSQKQLDTLLAPIALYPDTLLSQILIASTYPLEVVEADHWLKQNQGMTGIIAGHRSLAKILGHQRKIIKNNEIIHQKDLGKDTEKIAELMNSYDPDSS